MTFEKFLMKADVESKQGYVYRKEVIEEAINDIQIKMRLYNNVMYAYEMSDLNETTELPELINKRNICARLRSFTWKGNSLYGTFTTYDYTKSGKALIKKLKLNPDAVKFVLREGITADGYDVLNFKIISFDWKNEHEKKGNDKKCHISE